MMSASHDHADSRLPEALRAAALGLHPDAAGTELIISHAAWLHRGDFTGRFIQHIDSGADGYELARIDWAGVIAALDTGQLPCSGGERRVLRLAASIAGGMPVSLRDTLPGLDDSNIDLVTAAIRHAAGQSPPTGSFMID
jgi:hypothetical protein